MTLPLQKEVVYGPVFSRRLGNSLGINILPRAAKFCHSSCIYCQYGWTDSRAMRFAKLPSSKELLPEIEKAFIQKSRDKVLPDSVTFSGNGEPTLHPEFGNLVKAVKKLRDLYFPKVPIGVLSDSSRVHLSEVREALEELDERVMKLDAGDPITFQAINHPIVKRDFGAMIQGLSRLSRVTLQSLFLLEPVDNTSQKALHHWLSALSRIHPVRLQIYTVSRDTADPRVKAVSLKRLEEIAHVACQVTDLSAATRVTETSVELA